MSTVWFGSSFFSHVTNILSFLYFTPRQQIVNGTHVVFFLPFSPLTLNCLDCNIQISLLASWVLKKTSILFFFFLLHLASLFDTINISIYMQIVIYWPDPDKTVLVFIMSSEVRATEWSDRRKSTEHKRFFIFKVNNLRLHFIIYTAGFKRTVLTSKL